MYESDSSSGLSTTYSLDKEIDKFIEEKKMDRQRSFELENSKRKSAFEKSLDAVLEKSPFNKRGMHLYCFSHLKIKFGYNPSEMANVSRKIKFICVLKYNTKYKYWSLGRHAIPNDLILKINDIFVKGASVRDAGLFKACEKIYAIYLDWTEEYEEIKMGRMEKYRRGEIGFMELDSSEEETYLSDEERVENRKKREAILERMIPPPVNKARYQLRSSNKKHSFITISLSSSSTTS